MASAGSVVAGKTPARGGETARVNQESRETTKYTKHTKGKYRKNDEEDGGKTIEFIKFLFLSFIFPWIYLVFFRVFRVFRGFPLPVSAVPLVDLPVSWAAHGFDLFGTHVAQRIFP